MLSRTASDLYWMSRYLERAENLARMLDVSYCCRCCRRTATAAAWTNWPCRC